MTTKGKTMYEYERVIKAIVGDKYSKQDCLDIEKELRKVHKNGLDHMTVRTFKRETEKALARWTASKGMNDE